MAFHALMLQGMPLASTSIHVTEYQTQAQEWLCPATRSAGHSQTAIMGPKQLVKASNAPEERHFHGWVTGITSNSSSCLPLARTGLIANTYTMC